MTENRRDLLASLQSTLESVSGIENVVRHYSEEFDISKYKERDLPLITIKEPAESPEEECTSMRAMMWLEIKLKVYFTEWELVVVASSEYETLMKAIRDKIGSDPNLNSSSVFTYVKGISEIAGEMPLYTFTMDLACRYYLDQTST